jgi:hypothetical protein
VLAYEERLVGALSYATDPAHQRAVADWVAGSLAAMPDVLRLGVGVGSLGLGAWARVRHLQGPALVSALEASPLPPVRQHLRLLRSLVLFADLELDPALDRAADPRAAS